MRVPLSWLKEFVEITISPAELAYRLTVAGVEVSKLEYIGVAADGPNTFGVSEERGLAWDRERIVVGQILEVLPHPNADRLVLADVEYGAKEPHRVVTGAPNIFYLKGQGRLSDGPKVVFAREGSQLYDGHAEGRKLMTLRPSKIRGIPSSAMVCSEKELGLSEEHEGIILLDPDAPVGTPLADYMGDVVLHIEILPNIARCQSIIGVAREAAALSGVRFKGTDQGMLGPAPAPAVVESSDWIKLEIDAPELCARYSAALIRGVQIAPSPEWMQRRLRLVGVRSISNVVDITNYVMMEWGQPLHAFDYDKLVQRARGVTLAPAHAAENPGDRDRWLDDGGMPTAGDVAAETGTPAPSAAGSGAGAAALAEPTEAVDTPHIASDRDRWLDDGGPALGTGSAVPGAHQDPQAAQAVLPVTPDASEPGNEPAGVTPTIIVRRALPGEHLTTLDGVDRALTPDMLLIADGAGAIGLAGIMGGAETEIDAHTTNVLLEAAAFNFINNRKTAAALKLPSEATARFGRGVPPAHTIPAATRGADLMRKLAQGEPAPQIVDAYPGRAAPAVIAFDTAEIRRLLGIDVPAERIMSILRALDFEVREPVEPARTAARMIDGAQKSGPFPGTRPSATAATSPDPAGLLGELGKLPSGESSDGSRTLLAVIVPEHRLDVAIPADIVEEVARVIGYDQIPATLMRDELPPQRHNASLEAEELVRDIMVGCGLQEIISYPLTTVEREALLFPVISQADLDETAYVTIANPISPERKVMRHTLLASVLDTLREALRHRERVLLFEIGRVYLPQAGNLPSERTRLTIALAGPREPQSWLRGQQLAPLDFFDLKGIVDTLIKRLHVQGVTLTASEHPSFHPARSAALSVAAAVEPTARRAAQTQPAPAPQTLGVFGEVHPEVREHFALPNDPVCLAEFDLDALRAAMSSPRFEKPARFPAIREDIALVVDEAVPAAQIEALIREAGGAMLRSTTLFDVYRGEQVGAGRKSLAYALTYQHDERTLTDDEAAKIRGRIVKKLRDSVGAELRG